VGALTLKSFPFELKGWDVEEHEGLDPTDGFGSNIRVYVNKDQVIQIEPDYDNQVPYTWITDKGRQFFDGVFVNQELDLGFSKNTWLKLVKNLKQNLYVYYLCSHQSLNTQYFTIVFQNVSLEILSLLNAISNSYSFIKIRKAENTKINNDLESNFQLNMLSNKLSVKSSTLCLLISTNTRFQGYRLNLNLRQKFFKGNFECILMGSLIDLTFPITYLGSNLKVLKHIVCGSNSECQNLIKSKSPSIVFNDELLNRNDNSLSMLKALNNLMKPNYNWNGLNCLNSSLESTGQLSLTNFLTFNKKDFVNFSSLYLINVNFNQFSKLKKIVKSKLLNYVQLQQKKFVTNKLVINQNVNRSNSLEFMMKNNKLFYVPISTFFEDSSTFINTQGIVKRTSKISFNKKNRSSWQLLRKFLKTFQKTSPFLVGKDSNVAVLNINNYLIFKSFISFNLKATQNLTSLSYYLYTNNNFFFTKNFKFKSNYKKIYDTKLKYWLDDFFIGGKDDYSQNSLVLINCSKIIRSENTNFF